MMLYLCSLSSFAVLFYAFSHRMAKKWRKNTPNFDCSTQTSYLQSWSLGDFWYKSSNVDWYLNILKLITFFFINALERNALLFWREWPATNWMLVPPSLFDYELIFFLLRSKHFNGFLDYTKRCHDLEQNTNDHSIAMAFLGDFYYKMAYNKKLNWSTWWPI